MRRINKSSLAIYAAMAFALIFAFNDVLGLVQTPADKRIQTKIEQRIITKKGIPGPRGATGPAGRPGVDGVDGVDGKTRTRVVVQRTVVTRRLQPVVVNRTTVKRVLLTRPGPTGAQGPAGPTGPRGPAGTNGVNGVSPSVDAVAAEVVRRVCAVSALC